MKLISCYIEGFGKIKNMSYDFSDGLNAFCQENGWGKTTFCVFLKAMLYGMEYSSRKKELMERPHYLPWDGSPCKGSLTFEVEGRTYRVERTFDPKGKDSFALFDAETGLVSSDYSENLGEELFLVDAASFERSIFVPQNVVGTALTDSLNAKLGGLSDARDDMNNFDAAIERVDKAQKDITRKSKVNTGSLVKVKEEISICNEVIDRKSAVVDGYDKQILLLDEKKKTLNWMEAEKNRLAEAIRLQSKREQQMGAYNQQKKFLEEKQSEIEKLDDFFAAGLPEEDEQTALEDIERQYDIGKRTEEDLLRKCPPEQEIAKWESLFADHLPEDEEIADWQERSKKMQSLRLQGEHAKLSEEAASQLEQLRFLFSDHVPTEEELDDYDERAKELSMLEGRIVAQQETYQKVQIKAGVSEAESGKQKASTVILLFVLSAALIGGGIAFHLLASDADGGILYQLICFVGAAATGVAAIMQLLRIRSVKKSKEEDLASQLAQAEETLSASIEKRDELNAQILEFIHQYRVKASDNMQQMLSEIRVSLEHYKRLTEEEAQATAATTGTVEEISDIRLGLYTVLDQYAAVYGMELYHEDCEDKLFENLIRDKKAYEDYKLMNTQMQMLKLSMEKQQSLLQKYFSRFPLEEGLSSQDKLSLIRTNREKYAKTQEEIAKMTEELQSFAVDQEVDEKAESVEQLQEKQNNIDEEIKDMQNGIAQDRETLHQLSVELDSIEDAEGRLEILTEQKIQLDYKLSVLERTAEYLREAKEKFMAAYMAPLRKGMEHYLSILDDKAADAVRDMAFEITIDLEVMVRSAASTYRSEYLSCGYQDLVGLCARFALVDVLYKKECPTIVLDDPFTNLDESKIGRAMDLLQEISKERQIIYFTCHESRLP